MMARECSSENHRERNLQQFGDRLADYRTVEKVVWRYTNWSGKKNKQTNKLKTSYWKIKRARQILFRIPFLCMSSVAAR